MNRKIVLAVLCVVMFAVWAVTNRSRSSSAGKPAATVIAPSPGSPAQKTGDAQPPAEPDILQLTKYIGMKEHRRSPSDAHDPFRKIEAERASLEYSDLILSGVMVEEGEPIALINNQIFREGDVFSGFKVITITESEVVLQKGLEKYVLKLFSGTGIEEGQNVEEGLGY